MKRLFLLPFVCILVQCAASGPQIVNVSAYDPKEKQRSGRSYSEHDVSALRANGAKGLIARAGKGGNLDTKCAGFLASADREGLLPGVYYRTQVHVDPVAQADQFVSRAQSLANSRSWKASSLLLCADLDANSSLSHLTRFLDRIEARTGVVPVIYLENSTNLKRLLSTADAGTKARLRRSPYWLALYSHASGGGGAYPAPGKPENLVKQYGVWNDWTLWQYGGVDWEGGRSQPKVYSSGRWRFSRYFGNLDRPVERNVFKGTDMGLHAFWRRHGIPLKTGG